MLNILSGRAGSGKTTLIINEIIDKLNNVNDEQNIILFVPEQMSFQAEYEIAKKVSGKSYHRLQVFSFKRLAYRLFLEVGGFSKTFISDLAVEMMITKIIEENKDRFTIYNKLSANYNFVSLVHELIKEFKSYLVGKEMIEVLMNDEMDVTLKNKLHDMFIIYDELAKLYDNRLIDNEDFYLQLTEKIKESTYLQNAMIYIDGYHSFTLSELAVVENIIKHGKNVTMLLTIDDLTKVDMTDEANLFHLPYKTAIKLINYCNDEKIEIKMDHLKEYKRFKNDSLTFLADTYENNEIFQGEVDGIEIIESETPTSEVFNVARIIYNDVFINQRTFSDYVIYINNQDVYYPLIKNIFRLYDIPVFIDDKKIMLDHSLINFIDASLEVIKTNFRYEAIFRAIKTEIFIPLENNNEVLTESNYHNQINKYRNRLDLLENFCLSHGITGNMWGDYWPYDKNKKITDQKRSMTEVEKELELIINQTRTEIAEPLLKFRNAFNQSKKVIDKVKAVYQLLEDIQVEKKIDLYEKIDNKNNELNNAKKHKQAYNKIIEIMDELVEVCGDYELDTDEFIKILQTGLKGMKFAIVPPAIDQVMVGTLKRSRYDVMGHFDDHKSIGVKKAFVLGVNENEIPKIESDSGLITNKEREYLISHDVELIPTIERSFLDDYFIIYTVICSPSEKLILSYTLSNNEKKEAFPSEIIEKVKQKFPKLKVKTLYDFPTSEDNQLEYITSIAPTTSMLLSALNNIRKGYSVDDIWKALYGYYKHSNVLQKKLLGVTYKNEAKQLDMEDVKQIYQDTIHASVSSIEKYNSCPYQYFIDKGLGVKERDIQSVEAMDIGDLYHETLKEISLRLIKEKIALHQIPLNELNTIIDKTVEKYAEIMQRRYFYQSKRNNYLLWKIKQSLIKSLEMMHYQSSHSKFKILAVEEKFGSDASNLIIPEQDLSTGLKMRLKGFIDRIDVAYLNEKDPFIRIIDYKSGNKDIDFTKIYHKLSLQLFTYLDVVLQNSEKLLNQEAKAAGVAYYHIHHSEVNADTELSLDEIKKLHCEAYKMNGYTLGEKEVSLLFDDKLLDGDKSDIVKIAFTKTGYHKTQSKVLDEAAIHALRKFTKKALIDSTEEISKGKIDIKPVMYAKVATCKYCNYHAICKFDSKLRENQYNMINRVGDSEEIIEKIKEEFGSDQNE